MMKKMIMCKGGCLSVQGSGYPPVTRDSSDFVPQTHFVPPKTHFHDIFVRGGRKNSLLRGCECTKSLSIIAEFIPLHQFQPCRVQRNHYAMSSWPKIERSYNSSIIVRTSWQLGRLVVCHKVANLRNSFPVFQIFVQHHHHPPQHHHQQ